MNICIIIHETFNFVCKSNVFLCTDYICFKLNLCHLSLQIKSYDCRVLLTEDKIFNNVVYHTYPVMGCFGASVSSTREP